MISPIPRQARHRLAGWLVCVCLVVKPLLLLGHVLTDAHCLSFESIGGLALHQETLAHLGIEVHEHEHGIHAHEDHCHVTVEHGIDEVDGHEHHGHCPHPLAEHFETLTGDPADLRGDARPQLVFLQLALDSSAAVALLAPVEWWYRSDRPEAAWNGRVDDAPPLSRGPPVA